MSTPKRIIRAQRPNPLRSIVSLGLLAIAALMFLQSANGELKILSYVAAALLLVVGVRVISRTIFAPHITLAAEGFRIGGSRPEALVAWHDVERFGLLTIGKKTFVIYSLKQQTPRSERRSKLLRGLPAEAEGYLPHTREMSPQDLMSLLNEWKARAN